MAHRMSAIQAYSPRVKVEHMVEIDEIVGYIADRTGLNAGPVLNVLMEVRDMLVHYSRRGNSIKLPGLGTFSPTIDKNGTFNINHLPDKRLIHLLNAPGEFRGHIRNEDMIGKNADDYIERWNNEHQDDKIKIKKA